MDGSMEGEGATEEEEGGAKVAKAAGEAAAGVRENRRAGEGVAGWEGDPLVRRARAL